MVEPELVDQSPMITHDTFLPHFVLTLYHPYKSKCPYIYLPIYSPHLLFYLSAVVLLDPWIWASCHFHLLKTYSIQHQSAIYIHIRRGQGKEFLLCTPKNTMNIIYKIETGDMHCTHPTTPTSYLPFTHSQGYRALLLPHVGLTPVALLFLLLIFGGPGAAGNWAWAPAAGAGIGPLPPAAPAPMPPAAATPGIAFPMDASPSAVESFFVKVAPWELENAADWPVDTVWVGAGGGGGAESIYSFACLRERDSD